MSRNWLKARAVDSDREDFVGPFAWPLQGPISGVYGSQRFYNGVAGRPHFGVDVAAPIGTQVRAPADATVTLAQPDLFFSGGTLIMDHGYGVSSTFMHLSRLLVEAGEQVRVRTGGWRRSEPRGAPRVRIWIGASIGTRCASIRSCWWSRCQSNLPPSSQAHPD